MSNPPADPVPPRCAAVVFARGFHHAGVHYVDADTVQQDDVSVRLLREGRVVWQGTAKAVAEVRFFADRHAALDFHRRRGRGLQQASGPRGGSTARTERAAYVEGVRARLRGDEEGA